MAAALIPRSPDAASPPAPPVLCRDWRLHESPGFGPGWMTAASETTHAAAGLLLVYARSISCISLQRSSAARGQPLMLHDGLW
jgi:hypothetical protein